MNRLSNAAGLNRVAAHTAREGWAGHIGKPFAALKALKRRIKQIETFSHQESNMAVQKSRVSPSRRGQRRSHDALKGPDDVS